MATDLGRVKSAPSSKYDAFVAAQLARAEGRIRLLDLSAGLLGFAALGLAYVVGMVLCDSKFELTPHTRQLSLYGFLAVSAVYLFFLVVRPLRLRVNPYYAARQVEQQLPEAKNSIVNWVDLHEQPLPPAIRGALGQRAAKDLSRVDLDRVISGRRAAWMGGLAGAGLAAFIVSFFLLGPAPFFSLMQRAFNPFGQVGVSTRTQLAILKPEGGNAVVTVGRGINFVVEVTGKVPDRKASDAVKLLYRYEESDPWLERLLMPEVGREWTTALSAIEVKNGFWYRVTGGDAATEEYRVSVRAAPAILDFLAVYHPRRYVARADEVRRERELKALRGTEVRLHVRTNRALREGRLEFLGENGNRTENGRVDPNDPHVLMIGLVLDQNGKYRLHLTSTDSEAYSDAVAHAVTAIPDNPPMVELTKPGQDIRLPADALLHLEGKASDDVGVKSLVLQMRVVGGEPLRGKPYRSDDKMRLADGGYPREVEYKDYVELSRVRTPEGKAFPLRAGMELEYWLEASDACDYPQTNLARSKTFRVLLTEPEKNEKKAQDAKKQAEQDHKKHEDKEDQKRQQENEAREQERKEQEARNQEEQAKSNEADKPPSKEDAQPNNADGQNQNGNDKEQKDLEKKIQDALDQKNKDENQKGEAKPELGDKGDDAGAPENKPAGGDNSESEGKDKGQQGSDPSGEGKDKGQPQGGDAASEGKGENQPNPMAGDKGEAKDGNPMNQPGAGEPGEGKGKPEGAKESNDKTGGDAKGEPKGSSNSKDGARAEAKPGGAAPPGDSSDRGEAKPSAGKAQAESKPDAGAQARDAKPKDIDDLAKKLQDGDAQQRQEAKQQLERIVKDARDPQARAGAEEALDQVGQPDGPADSKPAQPGTDPADNPVGEGKDGTGDGSKDAGSSKPGGGAKGQGDGDAKDAGTPGQQDASPNGTAKNAPSPQGGNTPGGGGNRRPGDNNAGGPGDPQGTSNKPSKPREHRAAQMQLEDFRKKVDRKVLKDAGVSEEAWKKYLEARRKQLATPDTPRADTPANPQQAKTLPSIGPRPIQPAASGPTGDAHAPDRGQPPPGYRDPFREFNRKMSKSK